MHPAAHSPASTAGPSPDAGLRVLCYVGPLRPHAPPDYGRELIEQLQRGPHKLIGIILHAGDPLWEVAPSFACPVHMFPPELCQPQRRVRAQLDKDDTARRRIETWCTTLASSRPDVGIVYYGYWLPPNLFTLPRHRFLNYHPAPLPDYRGMEPDTLAILDGRESMHGTVHQVSENYDEGLILGRTESVPILAETTPRELFGALSAVGITTIIDVLDQLAAGTAHPQPQGPAMQPDASRQRVRQEAWIDWTHDTCARLQRRRHAFIGQDIGIRLKVRWAGTARVVEDLETHVGTFPGKPGDVLAAYHGDHWFAGHPVVRCLDGLCVLRLGEQVGERDPPSRYVLPPGPRPNRTHLHELCPLIDARPDRAPKRNLS
jgi:methionyl-tRNA formyltransferase